MYRHATDQGEVTLPCRYTAPQWLGRGTFAEVWSAVDTSEPTKRRVAIKKMNLSQFMTREEWLAVIREVRIMTHFTEEGADELLPLLDLMLPLEPDYTALYLVTPLMAMDLAAALQTRPAHFTRPENVLSVMHALVCQFPPPPHPSPLLLTPQFRGLYALHSANVFHRDLKPENILLDAQGSASIADFGLACELPSDTPDQPLTVYVATRWYRAPELLLGEQVYNAAVDIWSMGCIFAEILNLQEDRMLPQDRVLFYTNPQEQSVRASLTRVLDWTGHNPAAPRPWVTTVVGNRVLGERETARPRTDPAAYFPHASAAAVDLLSSLLALAPGARAEAHQALAHGYFGEWAWTDDDLDPYPTFVDDFSASCTCEADARAIINKDVRKFHPGALCPRSFS